jgi:hypothetical protein
MQNREVLRSLERREAVSLKRDPVNIRGKRGI